MSTIPSRRSAVTWVTEYVSKEKLKSRCPLVPAAMKQDVGSTPSQENPALLLSWENAIAINLRSVCYKMSELQLCGNLLNRQCRQCSK